MRDLIDRRQVLTLGTLGLSVAVSQPSSAQRRDRSGFSLALGGGSARGLAHIPVLEALDELGVAPKAIAGTSIGAIIGACYASGLSAREIRDYATTLFATRLNTLRRLFPRNPRSWASVFSMETSSVLEAEVLMEAVLPEAVPAAFSDLRIPLSIVTTDFYSQSEFVISDGPLHRAIGASAALPVFVAPVRWQNRVLIDGGFVNPTPFDVLDHRTGYVVAVDVTGNGSTQTGALPGALQSWIGASQIAIRSLVNERLKRITPDLLIRPDVGSFDSLEFNRIDEILAAGEAEKERVKQQLGALLEQAG